MADVIRQIWDDWSNAAAHNGTYAIHPSQNHTGLPGMCGKIPFEVRSGTHAHHPPANINDNDLADGRPFKPQPAHTYTVCWVHYFYFIASQRLI
jgi:hypothetical protein